MTEPRDEYPPPSDDRGTPLGVTAVTLVVALYGGLWLLSSLTAVYGQSTPNLSAVFGPFVGLTLLLIAIGLWKLQWTAWTLTVVIFGGIVFWNVVQIETLTLESVPFVPVLVVAYLLFKQDVFFRNHSGE